MTDRPYPGLRPFDRHEAGIFFGRERQTDELLARLGREHFLAVSGASGCGKSSLVRAGLMAALEAGLLPQAGACWRMADMRPGQDPFGALADALLHPDALGEAWSEPFANNAEARAFLLAALRRGSLGLVEALGQSSLADNVRLLLVVDQFEELFRYVDATALDPTEESRRNDEAAAFVELLLAGVGAKGHGGLYLCLTLRSDFLGDCARFRGLPERINAGLYLTPRLTRDELTQAIAWPAQLFNGEVEPRLVNRLVNEASDDPDQLPLLQHALMRLWAINATPMSSTPEVKALPLRSLTLAEFERMGGLQQALSDHADAIFNDLDTASQIIAKTILCALTERENEGRDIRRQVRLDALAELVGAEWQAVARVVDAFRAEGCHFLTPSFGNAPCLVLSHTIDISHESLIRQWKQLQEWVAEEAKTADDYRRLLNNQHYLTELKALLDSPELENASAWRDRFRPTVVWAKRYGGNLEEALDFLRRSERHRDMKRHSRALAVLAVLVLLTGISVWALRERSSAENAAEKARLALRDTEVAAKQEMLAKRQAEMAAAQAEEERQRAEKAANSAELARIKAESTEKERSATLFDSQVTHGALLTRMEDYAQARTVLDESQELDGAIPESRRHARNLLAGYVEVMGGDADKVYSDANAQLSGGVAVSRDGKWLAAAGERGTLVIFDAQSGDLIRRLEGHNPKAGKFGIVRSVVFDAQSRWLFSGGDDGRIVRWSIEDGSKLEWQGTSSIGVMALALSPDGTVLASGDAKGRISIWSTTDSRPQGRLFDEGHADSIAAPNGLAFSPDGTRLASASFDNSAQVWNLVSGKVLNILSGHGSDVEAVAFSPNGKLIVTAGIDRQLIIWDAESGLRRRTLLGHQNGVYGAVFTADSCGLVSASRDHMLRLWDVERGVTLRIFRGHEAGVRAVVRQDNTFYTAAEDATVRRWRLPDYTRELPLRRQFKLPGQANATAVAPDGTFVAVGFRNGSLRLFELPGVESHAAFSSTPAPSMERSDKAGGGTSNDAGATLPTLRPLKDKQKAHAGQVIRIVFNSTGEILATTGDDHTAKLWRVARGDGGPELTLLHTLKGHSATVSAAVFSPDGQTVATSGYDGRIALFNVRTGQLSQPPFKAHEGMGASIAYAADGTFLTTGRDDFTLRRWNPVTADPTLVAPEIVAKDIILWGVISPDQRQIAAVGRGSFIGLYDLTNPLGTAPRRLLGHQGTVLHAHYTPDGHQLATLSSDGTVRLWDLDTGANLFTLHLPDEVQERNTLWDFDLQHTPSGQIWISVPLPTGGLELYRLPYDNPPPRSREVLPHALNPGTITSPFPSDASP